MKSTWDQGEDDSSKRCVRDEFHLPKGEPVAKIALRLSFAVCSEDLMAAGVKRLNRVLGVVRKT
ncbi:MAG: hypothetical protein CMJ81_14970 [Planctomycetaceae bacterium]|nr:hypothetical protein [Planctomycetaceae bacterium]MBP61820.1 hypothetical protein [Planctomycetaceae bacterium]